VSPAKALSRVAYVVFLALLLLLIDRVAMMYPFHDEKLFLEDIDHRPPPDGIEINDDSIRDTRDASAFRESDFNVVILGDSFVKGFLLRPHQAIPQQFERLARQRFPDRSINAANFGWISASPYLSMRQLRSIGSRYRPDLVILCIDMTDFHDDIKYQKYDEKPGLFAMLKVLPSLFFVLKKASKPTGLHELLFGYPADRFFIVHRPLHENREYLATIQGNIDAIHAYATSELGARFALVIFPRYFQYDPRESPRDWERAQYEPLGRYRHEPFRYFEEIARVRSYPVRSLLEDFQQTEVFPTTYRSDPHWTAGGARVAAEGILRFVEEQRLLEDEPET
jgi:hypothetical protein